MVLAPARQASLNPVGSPFAPTARSAMTAKVGAKGKIPGRIFPRFDARTMRAVTRPPSIPFQTTSMPITRAICGDRSPFYAHGPRAHQATPASCEAARHRAHPELLPGGPGAHGAAVRHAPEPPVAAPAPGGARLDRGCQPVARDRLHPATQRPL